MSALNLSAAHPCALGALANVADAAMCDGHAKLVCIDCEVDKEDDNGTVALISVESDAAELPLSYWQDSLCKHVCVSSQQQIPTVSLAGALSRLSHTYSVIVRGGGGCHAIRVSGSRPPLAENWVHLEVGDREASLCEDKHNGTNVSEDDKTLLRQEASKLSAPGVRFVLHKTSGVVCNGEAARSVSEGLAAAINQGIRSIRAAGADCDLRLERPLFTQGVIEFSGHATCRGGHPVQMRLELLLGHAACLHGYLHPSLADRSHNEGEALEHDDSSCITEVAGIEVKGMWSATGRFEFRVTGECGVGSVVFQGAAYRGVIEHGADVSSARGTISDATSESESGSESTDGEFLWHLTGKGAHQRREWQNCGALRTSAMAFFESHYKQRCELKLCGTRVKRRSLLQRMSNPRTFPCVFRGIEADGSDRIAVVTVGTATDGSQEQDTGFFLYQYARLIAGCVPITLENDRTEGQLKQSASAYLGVADMGLTQNAVGQRFAEGSEKSESGVTGLEWSMDLRKWRVVEKELQRVLAEYAGILHLNAARMLQTDAGCEHTGAQVSGKTEMHKGATSAFLSGGDASHCSSDSQVHESSACEKGELAAEPGRSEALEWEQRKEKIVDGRRCRVITGRGTNALRCSNPPIEGSGGLCSFHCKKPKDQLDTASPHQKLEEKVSTLASTRQPRRIIKSSRLAEDDDSEAELTSSRAVTGDGRAGKRSERTMLWKEGDRAWIMDVEGVSCPIARHLFSRAADTENGGQAGETEGTGSVLVLNKDAVNEIATNMKEVDCERQESGSKKDTENYNRAEELGHEGRLPAERQAEQKRKHEETKSQDDRARCLSETECGIDMEVGGQTKEQNVEARTTEGTKGDEAPAVEVEVEHEKVGLDEKAIDTVNAIGNGKTVNGNGADGADESSLIVKLDAEADVIGAEEALLDEDPDTGGLPSLSEISGADLLLLDRDSVLRNERVQAPKNLAISKVILTSELAVEIYLVMPEDRSLHKQRAIDLSSRYGVAPKTIRDVWDRKTWSKATQHLVGPDAISRQSGLGMALIDLPSPSSQILLGTLVSGRLACGKYRVKLDDLSEVIECYVVNLNRFHPLSHTPADPAWAQAEEARRLAAEKDAAAKAAAFTMENMNPRKRGRRSMMQAESKSGSQGGQSRPQRNTLEGRCRTVLARLMRSEATSSLGELQDVLNKEEKYEKAALDAHGNTWQVLDELHKVSERAERKSFVTFFEFWEDMLNVWRKLDETYGRESPLCSLIQQVAEEFDRIFEDTFTDDLCRLRAAPGDPDDETVDGMDLFGLRVCIYNARERRLQYGMVDDADEGSVHIVYDDEEEGWVTLPSKELMILRPPEEESQAEVMGDIIPNTTTISSTKSAGTNEAAVNPQELLPLASKRMQITSTADDGVFAEESPQANSASHVTDVRKIVKQRLVQRALHDPNDPLLKAHVKLPEHVFQLGIKVEVLYDDGTWYLGCITQYNQETGQHRIVFDDGDWQEISLPDPDVRLACLTSNGESPQDLPSEAKGTEEAMAYLLGDLVWWQYTKGEWWPARVTSLQQVKSKQMRQDLEEMGQPDDDSVLVHTFGDRTFAWVDLPPDDMRGFGLHAELLSQSIGDQNGFEKSVKEALFLWQRLSAPQRNLQTGRYLILEDGGAVTSNVKVEYLQPKLTVVETSQSPPPTPKPARVRGAAATTSHGVQATPTKGGRSNRGAAASGAAGLEIGSGDGPGEVGKRKITSAVDEDDDTELSVGGWRIAQALEKEKMQKEELAREHRLGAILSRMSSQQLLTALSLLGVALTRDQAAGISKLVATKLSALGFGNSNAVPSSSLVASSNNAQPDRREHQAGTLEGCGDCNTAGDGDVSLQSELPCPQRGSQSPSPPSPLKSGARVSIDEDGQCFGGGAVAPRGNCGASEDPSSQYLGVTEMDEGWSADILEGGARLHLGVFPTVQEAAMAYDVAALFYLGEDASCNFPPEARKGSDPGHAIVLDWWVDTAKAEPRRAVEVRIDEVSNEDSHATSSPDSLRNDPDGGAAAVSSSKKRQRDAAQAQAHDNSLDGSTTDGLKKPKRSSEDRVDSQCRGRAEQKVGEEWNSAEWHAFRKRLARETAAAEASEVWLRRTKMRSRQVEQEVKRREDTYREILQRWSRDLHARSWWQGKIETMLLAIEHMRSLKAGSFYDDRVRAGVD